MRLRWLPLAANALDEEYEYIRARNPQAAKRVFTRIVTEIKQLKQFPHCGRQGQLKGTRELVISGLPYLIIYRVTAEQVEILRVFHTARNPRQLG